MIDDRALARALTDAVLATPGIVAVFPVKPILHAASEGIANALDLDEPEVLVDVDRSDSLLTVTAHVATTSDCSTPEVLGRAAEALRAVAELEGVEPAGSIVVFVKARLIADPEA
ncbi:hypothetical protein C5B96_16360 [Subtercola sp. Z020]|uniref:hypothetical protein n=1 Tax=Subtercola sp. Z020 TaxID=2080582 RepID=UPI000CE81A76|nr:hypothetical protein [Subtercola sp. Z020]PPF76798.1 hypothetical protein C5B96_16360 [Subtercola sp. Z020]